MAAFWISTETKGLPAFQADSLGYHMLVASAEGRVDRLKEFIDPLNTDSVLAANRLYCWKEGFPSYRTPLYNALKYRHWSVVAFFLNLGLSWDIKSITKSGSNGISPFERMNLIENGLVHLLRSLLEVENINVMHVADLLTSEKLSSTRRYEVIRDYEIRKNFCQRLMPDDALYIMASLLIGSQRWKGSYTDLSHLYTSSHIDSVLSASASLNCNGLLVYASFLTGLYTMTSIVKRIFKGVKGASKQADYDIFTDAKKEQALKFMLNKQYATNLGLICEEEKRLDLNLKVEKCVVRVFYCVDTEGFVDHYGLIRFTPGKEPLAIHISQDSEVVVAKSAAEVMAESQNWKHIYLSMLPWHGS